ncbi:DUF6265 family protein [Chitinophaga sp. sic0106]|uniref:DUF6265 family protein n=1 Tax=Chitinophaga sp. sic0106 TaxID=2854785 RepID=UPI001C464553|nr:DUF6265 family protein [Chitinophaga sp. sic0106]MBV7530599.1 hypothetical protein [Chitinophaga sp. sic0106]
MRNRHLHKLITLTATRCLLLIAVGGAWQTVSAQASVKDFPYLKKLAGTWKMNTRKGSVVEQWQQVNDSTWYGRTWRVAEGDSSLQQSISLVKQGDAIYFMPVYTGHETLVPVKLKVRVLKPIGFVAEDLKNDFPQKVTYRFSAPTVLEARVQGTRDGTIEEYIFKYNK